MEDFVFKEFYKVIDEFIADYGAEASLMTIDSGVLAVLRYKIGQEPWLTILTQEDACGNNLAGEVVQTHLRGDSVVSNFKAVIAHSFC